MENRAINSANFRQVFSRALQDVPLQILLPFDAETGGRTHPLQPKKNTDVVSYKSVRPNSFAVKLFPPMLYLGPPCALNRSRGVVSDQAIGLYLPHKPRRLWWRDSQFGGTVPV